jgi:ABC-2 type transport system permease protein
MRKPASALRSTWLLTRLRLTRLLNQMSVIYNRPMSGSKSRAATPQKKRSRWLVTAFVGLAMLASFGSIASIGILNLHRELDGAGTLSRAFVGGTTNDFPGVFSDALTRGLTMQLSLLFCVTVLMSLGTKELAQPDWDLEWLVTLPSPMPALLWSRIVERSVASPAGVLLLCPVCTLIAWYSGHRWGALVVAAAIAIPLLLLAALARTLVDTGLRLSMAPSRLRNLQAVTSIVSVLLLYLSISVGTHSNVRILFDVARNFPAWPAWLPTGLVVRALNAPDAWQASQMIVLLIAETALALYAGVKLLESQLRSGVVAASSRDTARHTPVDRVDSRAHRGIAFGTAIHRRELLLLSRDRNYLIQSVVLPVVIVGSQLFLGGRLHNFSSIGMSETTMASIAFGIAAYMLMLSAFQTLNSEGGALWILYTVPRSLESVLYEKAQLWSTVALIYPVAVFGLGIALSHRVDLQLVGLAGVVALGLPIYAAIAVSLGVFGCDPLAQETRSKLRPTYVYLYMLLAGLYTYAIFASEWWQRLVLIVLSGLLAAALWQKARDELPFLLDPAASPPARVSTSDGVIGAMMFFVLQGVAAVIVSHGQRAISAFGLMVVFSFAGAVTYGAVRWTYWRSKTQGVPSILGQERSVARALSWGVAMGLIAALAGVMYMFAVRRFGLIDNLKVAPQADLSRSVWFIVLAVLAAPLFEEFIFRGLIYGGLRRSLPLVQSVLASAAVFAIVHPPASMIPVFGLGICAAVAYSRTNALLAPMIAHGVYNGLILASSLRGSVW